MSGTDYLISCKGPCRLSMYDDYSNCMPLPRSVIPYSNAKVLGWEVVDGKWLCSACVKKTRIPAVVQETPQDIDRILQGIDKVVSCISVSDWNKYGCPICQSGEKDFLPIVNVLGTYLVGCSTCDGNVFVVTNDLQRATLRYGDECPIVTPHPLSDREAATHYDGKVD